MYVTLNERESLSTDELLILSGDSDPDPDPSMSYAIVGARAQVAPRNDARVDTGVAVTNAHMLSTRGRNERDVEQLPWYVQRQGVELWKAGKSTP